MSSDARDPAANPATNTAAGGAAAEEAALIATFYGRRDKMSKVTIPDSWHDPDNNQFLYRFDPSAAHDTTIIQLALNARGDAASAWGNARQHLEGLLDVAELADLLEVWWGYTLTYQAVLAPKVGADFALGKLQPSIRRLRSSESLQPLAQARISGGKVWLLDIPTHGGGLEAATVYVALSPPGKEDALVKTIYGPGAALLMPDLIAHKSYYQMREYRGEKVQDSFKKGISYLRKITNELLESDLDQTVEADYSLEALACAYPRFIPVVSMLKELHTSLVQQSRNYDQWRAPMKYNGIIEYHRGHIEVAASELELLVTQCQDAIDTANTAVSIAQVQVSKAQAIRQWWIATLLGVVGLAVSLRGILAWEGVEELLGLIPMLEPYSGNFFLKLGTQIGIILVCALLLVLIVSQIRKRRRKKQVSNLKSAP